MLVAIGRKTDHKVLEASCRAPYDQESLRTAVVTNYGGLSEDYVFYAIEETAIEAVRYMRGDECSFVWGGDAITGIDFTKEDSYKVMRFFVTDENGQESDTLVANGIDYLTISASIWDHEMLNMDSTFSGEVLVPLMDPDKRMAYTKIMFVDGEAQKIFKTTKYGIWRIPNKHKFTDINVITTNETALDINAIMDL